MASIPPAFRRRKQQDRNFIQYHKTFEYGTPGSVVGDFGIETGKNVVDIIGVKTWLITGDHSPREYHLDCWFWVESIVASGDPDRPVSVRGSIGEKFDRSPIVLNAFPWFQELRKSLGDFAAGYTEIESSTAKKFEALADEYRALHQ
jgi:hypothetical protein